MSLPQIMKSEPDALTLIDITIAEISPVRQVFRTATMPKAAVTQAAPKTQALSDIASMPQQTLNPQVSVASSTNPEAKASAESSATTVVSANSRTAVTPEEIYIAELRSFLEKKKKYPALAKKMGQSGKVKIKFEINRDGKITNSQIAEASHFESLNKSAKTLIDEIQMFKPFPAEVKRLTWQFIIPIEYKL